MHPITKLVAQRLGIGLLLLLAVSVLIFAGTEMLPGDVAQAILGQSATPVALANLREQMGLNDPAHVRYFHWLVGILHGDLGTALTNGANIRSEIADRLGNTLFLAFWAAIVAVPLAITLGLLAVRYRNRWPDRLISGVTLATISLPEFVAGYILMYLFAVKFRLFSPISTLRPGMTLGEELYAIALPVAVLVLVVLAHMMRMTRAAIILALLASSCASAEPAPIAYGQSAARSEPRETSQAAQSEPASGGRARIEYRGTSQQRQAPPPRPDGARRSAPTRRSRSPGSPCGHPG